MHRILSGTVLALTLGVGLACAGLGDEEPAPTRFDDVVEQLEEAPPQPIGAIVEGDAFNAMFPAADHQGFSRTFTQEKEGYAEAEYTKGDQTITLSISDTRDNPTARDKFASATETIADSPVMQRGNNSSMVLVAGRFQVRASSRTIPHEERVAWLSAVDLATLATLH